VEEGFGDGKPFVGFRTYVFGFDHYFRREMNSLCRKSSACSTQPTIFMDNT
jgi:hypothetical protein